MSTQTVPNVHFDETKFVLPVGLAFGAIHRYIDKPPMPSAARAGGPVWASRTFQRDPFVVIS